MNIALLIKPLIKWCLKKIKILYQTLSVLGKCFQIRFLKRGTASSLGKCLCQVNSNNW